MIAKKSAGRPRITAEEQKAFRLKVSKTARQLFFEEGFESVSMRRIAKELDCNPMSLYQYFDSKYAILREIWDVIFEELFSHCEKGDEKHINPADKLRAVCSTYMHFWVERPHYFKVVYLTADPKSIELGKQVYVTGSAVENVLLLIKQRVSDCQQENVIRKQESSEIILQLISSAMFGVILCLTAIPEYPWMDKDEYITQMLDNTLRGLAA